MEIPHTVTARPDTGLWNAKLGVWLFLASEVMLFGGFFSAYIFLRLGADHWPHGLLNIPVGLFNTFVLITSSITMVLSWVALKMRQFGQFRLWLGITLLCGVLFLAIKSYEYNEKFHHFGVTFVSKEAADKYRDAVHQHHGEIDPGIVQGEWQLTGHLVAKENGKFEITPDSTNSRKFEYQLGKVAGDISKLFGANPEHHEEPVSIDEKDVKRSGYFFPKFSSYFAIYFTMTGLHALHVIGGMVVLGYFWGPGASLYRRNPEHLANRVEVGGLFWHFVDLVWIFLFPVLYLL